MTNQEPATAEEETAIEVEELSKADSSASADSTLDKEARPAESSRNHDTQPPTQNENDTNTTPPLESEPETKTPESDESDTLSIFSLKTGQYVAGRVKNITRFGAFVDIGLPQDGLVHISSLARRKVENVTDVVSEGQEVDVWVKKVDKKRGRISLTMIKPIKLRLRDINEGAELEGTVTRLESYGAFIDFGSDRDGLVHISQITHDYIKHAEEALAVGDKVKVRVLKVNRKKRQVDLSIKALLPPPEPAVEKVEAVKEVKSVKEVEDKIEVEESAPTAMALAYAAFQDENTSDEQSEEQDASAAKNRKKQELEEILTRTLATREES